jgi:hypothetical protein
MNNNNNEIGIKLDNEHWYGYLPKSVATSHEDNLHVHGSVHHQS